MPDDKTITSEKPSTALAYVTAIPPYPPGRPISAVAREFGLSSDNIVKLASNENPMGCSPKALAAINACTKDSNFYPDFDCFDLRTALAEENGISFAEILPGAGSSDLILQVARGWLNPGRHAIVPQYSFAAYESCAAAQGAETIVVAALGWDCNLNGLIDAVTDTTGAIFLATPNNPVGTAVDPATLEIFLKQVPKHVLVVIDEAYREFLPERMRPDLKKLMAARDNLLVLRTFSKIHGLAGLRVGYGIANPAIIRVLKTLQLPFSVSSAAQAAAIASLGDKIFTATYHDLNISERQRISDVFKSNGFEYVPSQANFILFHTGDGPALAQALMRRGVITRPVANYGLKSWLRVSVGLPEQNNIFLKHLLELRPQGSKPSP